MGRAGEDGLAGVAKALGAARGDPNQGLGQDQEEPGAPFLPPPMGDPRNPQGGPEIPGVPGQAGGQGERYSTKATP